VTSCRPAANEKVPDRDTWTMSRPGTAEPPVGIEPTTYSLRAVMTSNGVRSVTRIGRTARMARLSSFV